MDRPIFFCHIPKTAGTLLRFALESMFSPDEIIPSADLIRANQGKYPPLSKTLQATRAMRSRVKLFRGHYPLWARSALDNPITVTILREPIARTISHIKHRINHHGLTTDAAHQMLDDDQLPEGVLDNLISRLLGTESLQEMTAPLSHQTALLHKALAAIETVTILGLTEHLDHLASELQRLGVQMPIEHRNIGFGTFDPTERQMATIIKHNQIDMAVYARAREMLITAEPPSSRQFRAVAAPEAEYETRAGNERIHDASRRYRDRIWS